MRSLTLARVRVCVSVCPLSRSRSLTLYKCMRAIFGAPMGNFLFKYSRQPVFLV